MCWYFIASPGSIFVFGFPSHVPSLLSLFYRAFSFPEGKTVHSLCRHSLNVPHLLSAAPFSLGSALGMFWRSWEMGPCRSYRQISSVQRSPFLQRWKTTVSLPGSGGKQSPTFSKVLKKIPRNFHQTSGTVFSLMPVRQNDQVL